MCTEGNLEHFTRNHRLEFLNSRFLCFHVDVHKGQIVQQKVSGDGQQSPWHDLPLLLRCLGLVVSFPAGHQLTSTKYQPPSLQLEEKGDKGGATEGSAPICINKGASAKVPGEPRETAREDGETPRHAEESALHEALEDHLYCHEEKHVCKIKTDRHELKNKDLRNLKRKKIVYNLEYMFSIYHRLLDPHQKCESLLGEGLAKTAVHGPRFHLGRQQRQDIVHCEVGVQ